MVFLGSWRPHVPPRHKKMREIFRVGYFYALVFLGYVFTSHHFCPELPPSPHRSPPFLGRSNRVFDCGWEVRDLTNIAVVKQLKQIYNIIYYYIDMSVLPKNRLLLFSLRNYIRDTSEIFSISSLVKISLTSFLCFSSRFFFIFQTLIPR